MILVRSVRDAIVAHAIQSRPAECCGILIGDASGVREAVLSPNLSSDPCRYEIDPRIHVTARRDARERGLAVVGFYHSHPHSRATPSPTDVAEATYPDLLYLIVGLETEAADVRIFRLTGASFEEVPYEVA